MGHGCSGASPRPLPDLPSTVGEGVTSPRLKQTAGQPGQVVKGHGVLSAVVSPWGLFNPEGWLGPVLTSEWNSGDCAGLGSPRPGLQSLFCRQQAMGFGPDM